MNQTTKIFDLIVQNWHKNL